jgi:arylsulfatase A-like enzyme
VGAKPSKVVVLLLDSLNRHHLGAYGSGEFATPNLDRLAARSVRFDRHYAGSLPCMPARHDLLVGALDFLWRPWGSIEVWEEPVTAPLRRDGVVTMLVTDHPHLFETGGENYHTDFFGWDYVRGHENDPWRTCPDPTWTGTPALPVRPPHGRSHHRYDESRTWFRSEADYPGPRTMSAAAAWLRDEAPHHDRWLLVVDEFDPHEPFDTPEPWASAYDPDWNGPRMIWPPYAADAVASGVLTEREAMHLRAAYGSKLSMIDHWLGRVLDELDASNAWDDTIVVLCTDHGHYLGEHGAFGKPGVPPWNTLVHLPMFVSWPGVDPGVCQALTTTVDLHATICDVFGVEPEHRTHGVSLRPLVAGEVASVRAHVVGGYWGRHVVVIGAEHKYARSAVGTPFPLSMWSNRWSTMPLHHALPGYRLVRPDGRAVLERMPGSTVPVIRQPFQPGDMLPFWGWGAPVDDHHLHHIDDLQESEHLVGGAVEAEMLALLGDVLRDLDAPDDQFERLGLLGH